MKTVSIPLTDALIVRRVLHGYLELERNMMVALAEVWKEEVGDTLKKVDALIEMEQAK